MREPSSSQDHRVRAVTVILLTLLLWGCADKPQKKPKEPTTPPPESHQSAQKKRISLTLPASSHSEAFNAAEQALSQFDWMQASVTLQALADTASTPNDRAYITYLQARIAFLRGNQAAALAKLEKMNHPNVDPALRYRMLSFKASILEMQGDWLESALLATELLRTAPSDYSAAWKRNVWRNLERENETELLAARRLTMNPQWQGWLDLALISRGAPSSLPAQLSRWRNNHPGHPATAPLPGGLDYLQASPTRTGKVAILLPLSGKLARPGKAVLDGYLAAYYAARDNGGPSYELLILDVENYPTASSAYEYAVSQGAGIAIGPLSKSALADVATLLERPIPILALNRIDQVLPASGSALVQLSLAPQDEAQRVAEIAFGQGARRAIIIRPEGDWGAKVESALKQRWTTLGGSIASSATYNNPDEYSSSVKSVLSLDTSEQRASNIRRLLATNIESVPRRRLDPDVVFLLSRNAYEASSIKPLLAFHYAGNLPVYGISTIYTSIPDERNRDLEGIHLVETPWLLGANPELRVAIAAGDTGSGDYTQLNALGADAFLLQSEFGRLQSGADALLRGNTGLLSMDPNLRIHRELSAATLDGGVLKAQ